MKKNQLVPRTGKLSLALRKSFLSLTCLIFLSAGFSIRSKAAGLLEFKIEDNNGGYWDRFLMLFDATRSDVKENYDAAKMMNPEVNFYSFSSDNYKLSIDARPFAHNKVIRMGLTTPYKKAYYIRVVQFGVPTGMQLQLRDKYLDSTVILSLNMKYHFEVNNDAASQGEGRFEFKCVDPSVPTAPLGATLAAAPQYPVTGQDAYTIYKGYGPQQIALNVAATGGAGNYTYSWSPAATVISPTSATTAVAPTATTTYTVTVKDAANVTKTLSQTVYVIDATCDTGKVKVCDSGISQCMLPVDVSAYLAAHAGSYLGACLTVDAVITNVTCNALTNGGIDVTLSGARAPYTYTWSNNAITEDIGGLAAGNYTISVTSANGKTVSKTITVGEPAILAVAGISGDAHCKGSNDGGVELAVTGGNAPYTYLWNDSTTIDNRTALAPGNYSVTVTDAKGCSAFAEFGIDEPDALTVTGTVDAHVSCKGGSNGALHVVSAGGTGNYNYLWSDGGNTVQRSGLTAGNYSVTVTDANGCTAQTALTVNEPQAILVTGSTTSATCYGATNGAISALATGGAGGYVYLWNNGATTSSINNIAAGNYTLAVIDNAGCTATQNFTVAQPDKLNVSVSVSPEYAVAGQEANTIYLGYGPQALTMSTIVTGGTGGYSYSWSPGNKVSDRYAAVTDATPSITTNYRVDVTDANGCTAGVYQRIFVENVKCSGNKIKICHNGSSQCVTQSQANMHLAHGDKLGNCGGNKSAETSEEGIDEELTEDVIKVFPNPSTGVFNIALPYAILGGSIYVGDMSGRIVAKKDFMPDTKLSIDLAGMPKGIYLLRIANGSEVYNVRVSLVD